MNIYVFSDESGVFYQVHNDVFVFGGIVLLSKDEKEKYMRKYLAAERSIKKSIGFSKDIEAKATRLSNKNKGKLYRSLNSVYKFGAIIDLKKVRPEFFGDKKTKQRYLDFVYKIAVKHLFEELIKDNIINPKEVENIFFYVDEHTTATNGRYELREALEKEFKIGTTNFKYNLFFPPIFPSMKSVDLIFCDSSSKQLVRAADIVANRLYHLAIDPDKDIEEKKRIAYIKVSIILNRSLLWAVIFLFSPIIFNITPSILYTLTKKYCIKLVNNPLFFC